MKIILKSIAFLTFLILTISCSSDSGSGSGSTPCVPVTCLNGGVSTSNCGCTCPQGYSGANCSTQITPSKITITKIRVKKFPNLKPNGDLWDLTVNPYSRPDIFPSLSFYNGAYFFSGTPQSDSFSYGNDTFDFIPSSPIEITKITDKYTIALWDDDTRLGFTDQELMGGYDFYIYNSTGGFPTTIVISNSTGSCGFELTVSYTW